MLLASCYFFTALFWSVNSLLPKNKQAKTIILINNWIKKMNHRSRHPLIISYYFCLWHSGQWWHNIFFFSYFYIFRYLKQHFWIKRLTICGYSQHLHNAVVFTFLRYSKLPSLIYRMFSFILVIFWLLVI